MYGKSERFEDYDGAGRQPVAMGLALAAGASRRLPAMRRARVLVVEAGAIQLRAGAQLCVCGPRSALWLPPAAEADLRAEGAARLAIAFVAPRREDAAATTLRRVALTPLVHALLAALVEAAPTERPGARLQRLGRLFLDELRLSPAAAIRLPWPTAGKLQALCAAVSADVAQEWTHARMAQQASMSARTLSRRFVQETGMSVAQWVRAARLAAALTEVARGESVYNAAIASGFGAAPSLCTAFKRATGTTLLGYFRPGPAAGAFDEAGFFT